MLLGVAVVATGTSVQRGQTFVSVQLSRGDPLTGAIVTVFLTGYVTSAQPVAWPPGKIEGSTDGRGYIRAFTGTDPAAGAQISETVPTGARWQLRGFVATFTTDATAGGRRPRLNLSTSGLTWAFAGNTIPQASETWEFNYAQTGGSAGVLQPNAFTTVVIPLDTMLIAGSLIFTSCNGMQAGDNWSAPVLLIEEWLEP
jgi:hypothetical protein